MYNQNGTYFTEEYSVNFGKVPGNSTFTRIANTWDDWHLIPSSRPSIVPPPVVTKYVEIPGKDGPIDLTDYLTGRATYGQRTGTLSFNVDNDHENWDTIRSNIMSVVHGKKHDITMSYDPDHFYRGRFTVEKWDSGANWSSVDIKYELEPFKYNRKRNSNSFDFSTGTPSYTFYIPDVYECFCDVTTSISGGIEADVSMTRASDNRVKVVVKPADYGGDIADATLTIHWRGGGI